jgi:hypothetical protein
VKVLILGEGVIGTLYGAYLSAAGKNVCVLSHGPRTDEMAVRGLCARDALEGVRTDGRGSVPDIGGEYDIVLMAVRRGQLASVCAGPASLAGKPAIIFFGNNPAGRSALPASVPGHVYFGFPGIGVLAGFRPAAGVVMALASFSCCGRFRSPLYADDVDLRNRLFAPRSGGSRRRRAAIFRSAQLADERVGRQGRGDPDAGDGGERAVGAGDDRADVELGELRKVGGKPGNAQQHGGQCGQADGGCAALVSQSAAGWG